MFWTFDIINSTVSRSLGGWTSSGIPKYETLPAKFRQLCDEIYVKTKFFYHSSLFVYIFDIRSKFEKCHKNSLQVFCAKYKQSALSRE